MSTKDPQVNDYINPVPNTEVRLAYTVYTWDENMSYQRTAWSSIGSYYLNNDSVIYGSNQNQLIKTAGSAGVNVVDNTLGLIANVAGKKSNDVSPIIIYADGKYLAGLDNNTVRNHFDLHTKIDTIDLHFIETNYQLNNHTVTYTDLWGTHKFANKSTYKDIATTPDNLKWIADTSSEVGDIQENTFVGLIGESGGINRVTNKGFVYNALNYNRPYNTINTWRRFVDYVGGWTYGTNAFEVKYSETSISVSIVDTNNGIITAVTDADVVKLGLYKQEFAQIYSSIQNITNTNTDVNTGVATVKAYSTEYQKLCTKIDDIVKGINIVLGNENDPATGIKYTTVSQAAINNAIFTSTAAALAIYSNVADMKDIWTSAISTVMVEKLPWNSTFIDINVASTTTGFATVNDKTKTWQYTAYPTIDETWQKIAGYYEGQSLSTLLNQYPITATATAKTFIGKVWYTASDGSTADTDSTNVVIGTPSAPTSWSYYIYNDSNHNLINSANNFRFLGMKTEQENYSNSEGSNIVTITGFNKILLEDLYENPNNYQIPSIIWSWNDNGTVKSTTNEDEIPVTTGISYSLSITSALHQNGNFIVAGVGAGTDKHLQTGYNGVFYIPLPTDISANEDGQYEDTHWMLTTYTPQVNTHATTRGLWNNGEVLYKYTKMSNLITTGVFGGFTPYHTALSITANLVNIPQVSFSTGALIHNGATYVTAEENQGAKINKLISNIAYLIPANGTNSQAGTPWYNSFVSQITSNSDKCTIITLNSYEAAIIDSYKPADKAGYLQNSPIGNAMYLDLFGYKDEEWNNLSFDVNRKYIFTFNCHIQATNLNLISDQINYGTPSLLLLGHFRQRYAKSTISVDDFGYQAYPGETMLIPLLNKPLENPVNNVYNIEGTYTLSWNTTGSNDEKAILQKYSFYIPEKYNDVSIPWSTPLDQMYKTVYSNNAYLSSIANIQGAAGVAPAATIGIPNTTVSTATDVITYPTGAKTNNRIRWSNVMDRIYAFILVGKNVNPNVKYQFVNNNSYQEDNRQILATDDIKLFAGMNNVITTSGDPPKETFNSNPASWLGIDSGILGVCEPMFSMTIQRY